LPNSGELNRQNLMIRILMKSFHAA
jgi:hypothetical protein